MCRSGTDKVLPAFPIAQIICCIGLSPRTDSMALFIEQLVNGLTVGAVYSLVALGYTMVYGVMRMINFAHGDFFMIGSCWDLR